MSYYDDYFALEETWEDLLNDAYEMSEGSLILNQEVFVKAMKDTFAYFAPLSKADVLSRRSDDKLDSWENYMRIFGLVRAYAQCVDGLTPGMANDDNSSLFLASSCAAMALCENVGVQYTQKKEEDKYILYLDKYVAPDTCLNAIEGRATYNVQTGDLSDMVALVKSWSDDM